MEKLGCSIANVRGRGKNLKEGEHLGNQEASRKMSKIKQILKRQDEDADWIRLSEEKDQLFGCILSVKVPFSVLITPPNCVNSRVVPASSPRRRKYLY
jgi:hypothetical protein